MSKDTLIWPSVCHHIGAKTTAMSLLKDHVKTAIKEKWQTVLLGDIINNGVSTGSKHVGLEWGDCMDPMDQVELAIDTFMPLAKAGLLKGIFGGNHAIRTVKAAGLHPEKVIAMYLTLATTGKKPKNIMAGLVQQMHELSDLEAQGFSGGHATARYAKARDKIIDQIKTHQPGPEFEWSVPFFPGAGIMEINGISIACHHGIHAKTRDNWARLENSMKGHRMYFTGHNHRLDWQREKETIRGIKYVADYYSCGTYQGYEQYAQVAGYASKEQGSLLVTYDHDKDKARHIVLD
ncbi:hypothetical protein [uncultured Mediterranean phage]|nr:hypothetical protein [uncultured Mediterranean phage]